MAVRGVNFKSLVLAGFVAGYVMYFVDAWFAGFLGLFGAFPGTSNVWWMLEHHIDGIIFALPFAWMAVYRRLPGPGWLKGTIYGIVWTIALVILSMIAGALGAGKFQQMKMSVAAGISTFILHAVWGFFLGVLYVPPRAAEPAAGQ